jgi:hypothetical protein
MISPDFELQGMERDDFIVAAALAKEIERSRWTQYFDINVPCASTLGKIL